jgi:hypothetical protein
LQSNLISFESWVLLTSCFSHEGLGHLFLNCFTFYFFGQNAVQILGNSRFLALYLGGSFTTSRCLYHIYLQTLQRASLEMSSVQSGTISKVNATTPLTVQAVRNNSQGVLMLLIWTTRRGIWRTLMVRVCCSNCHVLSLRNPSHSCFRNCSGYIGLGCLELFKFKGSRYLPPRPNTGLTLFTSKVKPITQVMLVEFLGACSTFYTAHAFAFEFYPNYSEATTIQLTYHPLPCLIHIVHIKVDYRGLTLPSRRLTSCSIFW